MITLLVVGFLLVLVRVGSFLAFVPLFGGLGMPRLVKVGLALCLTVAWSFDLLANPIVLQQLAALTESSWLSLGLLSGREACLGALIGYTFGLLLLPARVAGEFLTQELGLSFGSYFDPASGTAGSPVTQLFDLLGTVLFLTLDTHHLLLAVFHATFTLHPLGGSLPQVPLPQVVAGASSISEWGVLLVAPTAFCLFFTTVALALLSRTMPQLNMYAVGFPLRLVVGLVALIVMLPGVVSALVALLGQGSKLVLNMV